MLPLLLSLVWLAVMTLVVAVCQTAARGDAEPIACDEAPELIRPGLAVWDRDAARELRMTLAVRRLDQQGRGRQRCNGTWDAPARRAPADRPS